MTNRARAKGTMAESAVVQFFNSFYPEQQEEEGYLWMRRPSKGGGDEGDVFGPFVSIEVKNYSSLNPISGVLLDNAKWKAGNARRRFWCLVAKPPRIGVGRVHLWPVTMTVRSAALMFALDLDLESVPSLCKEGREVTFFSSPDPTRWSGTDLSVRFFDSATRLWPKLSSHMDSWRGDVPTAAVFRRKASAKGGEVDPGEWFFCMNLATFADLLQRYGVVPSSSDTLSGAISS